MSLHLSRDYELANGQHESAVSFQVEGETLRGNLIHGGASRTGLLLLHGWGGVRSGPHNLLTYLARRVGEAGYPSLRFDFRGRGESDGDGAAITLGHMGEDAVAAARFLQQHASVHKVVLMGICSGGNVAIGILDRLPEAAGLYLLSVYPFGDGDSFRRDANRTAHYLKEYWRKLWLPATWRKFFRGELFYREIGKVLFGHFRSSGKVDSHTEPETRPSPLDNLLAREIPVQMVYGEADPDFEASCRYFRAFSQRTGYPISFETIAGANHNFYSLAWKRQLADRLVEHLTQIDSPSPTAHKD